MAEQDFTLVEVMFALSGRKFVDTLNESYIIEFLLGDDIPSKLPEVVAACSKVIFRRYPGLKDLKFPDQSHFNGENASFLLGQWLFNQQLELPSLFTLSNDRHS